ncbi:MAG: hypothetical protein IKN72_01790 [Clostridia bacterium]|nr:hypothetical protein [Clostridia bacterium]
MKAKRTTAFLMAVICMLGCFLFHSSAEETEPTVSPSALDDGDGTLASGLILQFYLVLSKKNSTTLNIAGLTDCNAVVVKCGYKNLKVQRRASSSDSWSDYYNYGNLYLDTFAYALSRNLTVDPGYQYRVTCKHYAKKNILNTQTISNTSNIVTF